MSPSKLNFTSALVLSLAASAFAQWAEPPPAPADPSTIKTCTYWSVAGDADVTACKALASDLGISWSDFTLWNPSVKDDCTGMISGHAYCIENNAPPSTTTTSPPTTTTPPGNGITTPTPLQPGQPDDCNKWHLVKSGELCSKIASDAGITLQQFVQWNPSVNADCSGLWANVYTCIGTLSFTPPPTTTTPGNGITTPSPLQPGQPDNCKSWHLVKSGEGCAKIASDAQIPVEQFVKWNPSVNADCSGLWANVYVCILTTDFKPTPTDPGNGITTPSPLQPGQPNNCKAWHLVKSGESCSKIASDASIPLDQFVKWNPSVNNDCSGLWANVYVCIMTTDFKPTPTNPGNGITTPSPTQGGQPNNCKTWYFVKSGETCTIVANKYKLTIDQIYKMNTSVGKDCSGLWANVYLCVATLNKRRRWA